MERSNQRPDTEGCPEKGEPVDLWYADDFVAAFGYRHEAAAFEEAVSERLAQYGLEVAAEKTKTIRFGHNGGEHSGRFDFLGFECCWKPDHQGRPRVKRRTASKRLQASAQRMTDWFRRNRHRPTGKLMRTLRAKLQGTWNYYGLTSNSKRMNQFYDQTRRTVHKWLNRRSQRESLTWKGFNRMQNGSACRDRGSSKAIGKVGLASWNWVCLSG